MNRQPEDFAQQGVSAAIAEKQYREYEDRRKHHIELILKETNNNRMSMRKTTSMLQRLAMPHDERILKTAYRNYGAPSTSGGLYSVQKGVFNH